MRKFSFVILLFINLFIFSSVNLHGKNEFLDKQKGFIKELFNQKKYFNCIAETRRLQSYINNKNKTRDYSYFILGNYFLGKQYKTIIYSFSGLNINSRNQNESILLSQSFLKIGLYNESIKALDVEFGKGADKNNNYSVLVRRIEPFLYMQNYSKAVLEIKTAKPYIPEKEFIELLSGIEKYKDLNFKSPGFSVALSVLIPGAGQVYSGKLLAGVLSFLGVAITVSGAYYFNKSGNKGMTYSMLFFSSLFYVGNIYSAYNSAISSNSTAQSDFISGIRKDYIPEYNPFFDTGVDDILFKNEK